MNDKKELVMYTVYDKPTDYPNDFVVRATRFGMVTRGVDKDPTIITKDYNQIVKFMEKIQFFRMERDISDDPSIKETWI